MKEKTSQEEAKDFVKKLVEDYGKAIEKLSKN